MNTNTASPTQTNPTNPSEQKLEDSLEGSLATLAQLLQARKPANGGDPENSYVARLMDKGPDAILKKIGEEATEVVLAAKDVERGGANSALVYEMADLWFHSMVALAYFDLSPKDVVAELMRRAGTSGINEKAMRKVKAREAQNQTDANKPA